MPSKAQYGDQIAITSAQAPVPLDSIGLIVWADGDQYQARIVGQGKIISLQPGDFTVIKTALSRTCCTGACHLHFFPACCLGPCCTRQRDA